MGSTVQVWRTRTQLGEVRVVTARSERPMPRLPYRVHHYIRRVEGRVEGCAVCPLPAPNRVHDVSVLEQVAAAESERYGN